MNGIVFPDGFLWGAATSGHQVEGGNVNSDWWAWEHEAGSPVAEPSGNADEHYTRYPADVALMAELGLNTYRFSVEWARVEPSEGTFDPAELEHYRRMVECVRSNGLEPMVTLSHFALPQWLAAEGGWISRRAPELFERYCRRVVQTLGGAVTWYCTINEPAVVATGGYVGRWGFPPGVVNVKLWRAAGAGMIEAHKRSLAAIHDVRPEAKAGLALFGSERVCNPGGKPATDFNLHWNEDIYIEAAKDDDFIGVQAYSRFQLHLPRIAAPLTRLALAIRPLEGIVVPRVLGLQDSADGTMAPAGSRLTQMGWEYRPEALTAVVRRIAAVYPEKDLVVTEHGVATLDDRERVEFIARGLAALGQAISDGVRVRGYIHWSLLDNFEWSSGYRPHFGLVGVDRATQERTVHPSARFLGAIARTGRLDDQAAAAAAAAAAATESSLS
jgi:beta-glucosidase